jgi:hypothetical protein
MTQSVTGKRKCHPQYILYGIKCSDNSNLVPKHHHKKNSEVGIDT